MSSFIDSDEQHRQESAVAKNTEPAGIIALGSIVILSTVVSYLSWNYLSMEDWQCDLCGLASAVFFYWLYVTFTRIISMVMSLFGAAVILFSFTHDLTSGWRLILTIIVLFFSIGIHMQGIRSIYMRHWAQRATDTIK